MNASNGSKLCPSVVASIVLRMENTIMSWTNCNLTFKGFENLLCSMHFMDMIVKLFATMKWFSAFFTGVGRFYSVLSVYHVSNDKCVNRIEKHRVTMLIQHYHRSSRIYFLWPFFITHYEIYSSILRISHSRLYYVSRLPLYFDFKTLLQFLQYSQ